MKRFEINVGNDFPLGENGPVAACDRWGMERGWGSERGRVGRFGKLLRVLFVLAVAVLVIHHPLHSAMILGLLLLVHRFRQLRRNGHHWRGVRRWRSAADHGAYV